MAKLTKAKVGAHAQAEECLRKDVLRHDENLFVLDNLHEGASHINEAADAFFYSDRTGRRPRN